MKKGRNECNAYIWIYWVCFEILLAGLRLLRQHTRLWQSAQETHSSDTWPTNIWVTIERCIHVNASSCGLSTLDIRGPAARLANLFGCIDLLQAYASTPAGKENGETAALLRDWYKEDP